MRAAASVARSLRLTDRMFLDLTIRRPGDVYFGPIDKSGVVTVNDVLRFADEKLEESGYKRDGDWAWTSGDFQAEVSKVDATLEFDFFGTKVSDIESSEHLARILGDTRGLGQYPDNWRIQVFWDGDGDFNAAVHNGLGWVQAYYRGSEWRGLSVDNYSKAFPTEPVGTRDYLRSKEPTNE